MAKRMNDDDVMNYVYGKLFGDLDGMESHAMFDEGGDGAVEGAAPNAAPETQSAGGMKITIQPLMVGAEEGERKTDDSAQDEDDEDKLKGISGMSPLMAQLHSGR